MGHDTERTTTKSNKQGTNSNNTEINQGTNYLQKMGKMFYKNKMQSTSIETNTSYEGESIEAKVRRIISNKEPITDGAPIIYTERKQGVQPSYNIRTDRFEIAIEAMQGVSKAHLAKREERAKIIEMKDKKQGEIGDQSIQGTDNK